ncbi:MAG: AI-2E family transporter [Candidatus Dormibacteraceae bacterium]
MTLLVWLGVLMISGWLLGHLTKTIITLLSAGLIAFALTPLVSLLARWIPRVLAMALVYLLAFLVILGLLGIVISTAAAQISAFVSNLPQYASLTQQLEPQLLQILKPLGVTTIQFNGVEAELVSHLQSIGTEFARQSFDLVTSAFSTVIDVILILILSVYLTSDGHRVAEWLRQQEGSSRRWVILGVNTINQVIGGYIRGVLTMATMVGVLVGVGLSVMQVPYAVLLGVLAFFMEFVPVIGVIISGVASVAIALTQGWVKGLIVLIYFIIIHVLEGDVVGPRIMGRAVGIHPAVALIALVAGTELFGIWGALLGAPAAGLLQVLVVTIWKEQRANR